MELFAGRPENVENRLEKEIKTYDLLDELGIAYHRVDHDPAETMQICEGIEQVLGASICKNLFLCNRQKTVFYLLLMPGNKPFRTKDLSQQLEVARLSFGEPEDMLRLINLTPGSVSVFGLMFDQEKNVSLIIDEDILNQENFGAHPCINTSTISITTTDLLEKVLPALDRRFVTVKL